MTKENFIKEYRKLLNKRKILENSIKNIDKEIYNLECPHDWSYSVDPAGDSSESCFVCSLCGKESKKIK